MIATSTAARPPALAAAPRLRFADPDLLPLWEKVRSGQRLDLHDGLALYRSPDLLGVGRMAAWVNERRNGDRVSFILNKHINPTNRCVAFCDLCAFGVHPVKAPNAYTFRIEEIVTQVERLRELGVSEVHMVGGMVKDVALDYFLELLPRMKAAYPELHIKAFTASRTISSPPLCKKLARRGASTLHRRRARFDAGGRGRDLRSERCGKSSATRS